MVKRRKRRADLRICLSLGLAKIKREQNKDTVRQYLYPVLCFQASMKLECGDSTVISYFVASWM